MVRIRLNRMGSKGRPYYRIVVAPSTRARGGTFVEQLGVYDPLKEPAEVRIDRARTLHWLSQGAKPTDPMLSILKREGLLQEFEIAAPAPKPRHKPAKPRAKKPKRERVKKPRLRPGDEAAAGPDFPAASEEPTPDEVSQTEEQP